MLSFKDFVSGQPLSGGGVPVPAGGTAAGDVRLQACPHPGGGLSVLTAEHPTAVPSTRRRGVGDTVPRGGRDATRGGGAPLHRGGPKRPGAPLLAASWSAGA